MVIRAGFGDGADDGDVVAAGADVVGAGDDGDVDVYTTYLLVWGC